MTSHHGIFYGDLKYSDPRKRRELASTVVSERVIPMGDGASVHTITNSVWVCAGVHIAVCRHDNLTLFIKGVIPASVVCLVNMP